jgi:uncharacterized protein (DUF1684 family)
MKTGHILVVAGLAVVLSGAAACGSQPPDDTDYVGRITAERADKDAAFRQQPNEPVPPACVDKFLPLDYFPVDPAYNVPAVLKPSTRDEVLQVATSTGTIEDARRLGELQFTLQGKPFTLTAFASADASRMWVPFRDATNGKETYKAGRYMDITRNATGVYELDFNWAYNPYCYFNIAYICPIPPPENTLDIPITAGEKALKSCP